MMHSQRVTAGNQPDSGPNFGVNGAMAFLVLAAVGFYAVACNSRPVATEDPPPPGLDMYLDPDGQTVQRIDFRPRKGREKLTIRTFDHEGMLQETKVVDSYLDAIPPEVRKQMTDAAENRR